MMEECTNKNRFRLNLNKLSQNTSKIRLSMSSRRQINQFKRLNNSNNQPILKKKNQNNLLRKQSKTLISNEYNEKPILLDNNTI